MTLAEARRTPLREGEPRAAEAMRVATLAAEVEGMRSAEGENRAPVGENATAGYLEAEIEWLRATGATAERQAWR